MILGTIFSIISCIGIYCFYNGNDMILFLCAILVTAETIRGYIRKELKSLFTFFVTLFIGLCVSNMFNTPILQAISVCICFENIIMFIGGVFMLVFTFKIANTSNSVSLELTPEEELTINNIVKESKLPRELCIMLYDIFQSFMIYKDKNIPYTKIETQLIPYLKKEANIQYAIVFGMLVHEKALSEEEAESYTKEIVTYITTQEIIGANK